MFLFRFSLYLAIIIRVVIHRDSEINGDLRLSTMVSCDKVFVDVICAGRTVRLNIDKINNEVVERIQKFFEIVGSRSINIRGVVSFNIFFLLGCLKCLTREIVLL